MLCIRSLYDRNSSGVRPLFSNASCSDRAPCCTSKYASKNCAGMSPVKEKSCATASRFPFWEAGRVPCRFKSSFDSSSGKCFGFCICFKPGKMIMRAPNRKPAIVSNIHKKKPKIFTSLFIYLTYCRTAMTI